MGGLEVVGDDGVLFACLGFSLSADSGLAAARFLFEGDLIWFSSWVPTMFPKLCMSESSGLALRGDMDVLCLM